MKRTGSDGAAGKSRSRPSEFDRGHPYLAICVANKGNEVSLQLGKAYKVIRRHENDPPGRIRVIDEDGEDYLYLADWFVPVDVPAAGKRRVMEVVSG